MRLISVAVLLTVILACAMAVRAGDNGLPMQRLSYHSVSAVTSVDRRAGFLDIKQDTGQVLRIYVDNATAGDRLETIRPGDIIREECVKDKRGILKALSIRLVRAAWKEIGTPEL
jgi:hypothetical protein